MSDPPRYADWKAPSDDGQMLIWPEPSSILAQAIDNGRRLGGAGDVLIQNVPLPEARRRARQFIGHDGDAPLIGTGHQSELYHPGVWVKNALINAVARKLGGTAFLFAVDSDAPKHLHLRWPGESWPITDDEKRATAAWLELLAPPTPRHLDSLIAAFDGAAAEWSFKPSIGPFFDSLRRLAIELPNLPSAV